MEADRPPRLTPGAARILEVASDLFYARGIHAVGVDTIAAESGVTKRTLYDRFGSKEALVAAYLQRRHARWWERFEQRIEAARPPRALAVFDAYERDAPSVQRGCAFLNAAGELPEDHPGYEVIREHKRAVRRRIGELIEADRPEAGDPEQLADHVFLLAEGAVAQRGIDGSAQQLRTARAAAADLLARAECSDVLRE
ncbi:TetR/AcrR family transcriptional regulator [Ruania halotolerans]|uniref:TetR/AcrR family transcriptional regulator n=1 Tax=Ruania halotolerans TaxID=2897773 RepID=UPI001E540962|nr:TetR/AcrR family transcriptional regulator [Ruania halotolerans]UFU05377.1 TetR/AcrR family transcriptional regulator [Ruania halotolerans]